MRAVAVSGYRIALGAWDDPKTSIILGATKGNDVWDGLVSLDLPEMTINDDPYFVSVSMRPAQARKIARMLSRAASILDPPKKKEKEKSA